MDGALKELAKLEKLTTPSLTKGKPSVIDSLDALLESLRDAKHRVDDGTATEDTFSQLALIAEERKKELDERQKEIYGSLARFGKAVDKVNLSFEKEV
jgi:hypothetical protein